jgi:hypothetical protein
MTDDLPEGRTPEEAAFISQLSSLRLALDYWLHVAADGSPWVIVSHDFVVKDRILDTLRLDFDGRAIRGGWSPAYLNWDDGVSAVDAGIDTNPPDGISVDGTPEELGRAASLWFERHIIRWPKSDRRQRWDSND